MARTVVNNLKTVEVLKVSDKDRQLEHYLQIIITQFEVIDETDVRRVISGSFDIKALYLYGPYQEQIGKIVCHLGSKTNFDDSVSLSNGDVLIHMPQLQGLRIASYMFNRVIRWAETLEPTRRILPFNLVKKDADTDEKRKRRNGLYQKHQMRLIFDDPIAQDEGRSDPSLTISELISFDEKRWCDSIQVMTWLNGYQELMHSHNDLSRLLKLANENLVFYKGKFDTFEAKVDFVRMKLSALINWPMLIGVLVIGFLVGYGLGINDLPGVIAHVKGFFGY